MKLSQLIKASDYEVKDWMVKHLQLSPYQESRLREEEIIRFSKFSFYKRVSIKSSPIWRLTIILFIPYIILLFLFVPVKWMFTGNRYIGQKFLDNFHYPWLRKMGL